jgi:hypothetical protein
VPGSLGKTLVIGFGYKARRGKSTACAAILEARKNQFDIREYSFGDTVRHEVQQALLDRWVQEGPAGPYDEQAAMQLLCRWAGVAYDANAIRDRFYPAGKQRQILQWWGMYRRDQDPDYWVKRIAEQIERDSPDVAIISNVRFFNEFELVKAHGCTIRLDRPGFEIDDGQHHISEVALDAMPDEAWSHILVNDGSEQELRDDAVAFFDLAVARLFGLEEVGIDRERAS